MTRCADSVSYTHLRAHETSQDLVCRLLLVKGPPPPPPTPLLQAEHGKRDPEMSRGLGDVYKRQGSKIPLVK
ncbi:hypothetical protein ACX3V1_22270 [Escherichia coli]